MYLYTDGGVILKNPSTIGGTWAWCLVDENDEMVLAHSGYITPEQARTDTITNNQTELFAVLNGLCNLEDDEVVEIRSDSAITLGRIFNGFSFNNVPDWMYKRLQAEKKRLINFKKFTYELMDGHPTKEQVERGTGRKGHMTSKWNVWCDQECGRQAKLALGELA
jgi:ribonuclease HI